MRMFQVVGVCHSLHVKVREQLCQVSFPLHLYVGSMDGIQLTGLCPLNYLFVSLMVVVLELAISAVSSGQQTPETRLCRLLEACCCAQLSCRRWSSRFRFTGSRSTSLPHWAIFPGPTPLLCLCLKWLFYYLQPWRMDGKGVYWISRGVDRPEGGAECSGWRSSLCWCFFFSACHLLFKT